MSEQKIKILIAEDDPFLSKIMGNRLREEGYFIEIAVDGQETLEKIESNGYTLVMLDLVMPVKTGFEVLQEVKEKGNKIPILVFTNLAQEDDRREVIELGAKGYYVKSDIAMDELVATVKNFVGT